VRRSLSSIVLLLALAGAPLASGCGASTRARPSGAAPSVAATALSARLEALTAHARDVEERLALAEAEARDLRAQLRDADVETRRRTVRIGEGRGGAEESLRGAHADEGAIADVEIAVPVRDSDGRPVLRLVGEPDALSVPGAPLPPMAPLVLPPAPAGVETRLPVMALPGADAPGRYARQLAARVAATPASRLPALPVELAQAVPRAEPPMEPAQPTLAAPAESVDGATADYRAALELVHTRRLEQALAALTVFIERNPDHAYVEGARYWRGEVHYAQREYARALAEFEELIRLAPQGRKTADALLKIGLCHRRMGDLAQAHLFFQRVLRQFPDTEAARTASRQDAS
jgi:tol-pal system protein YbgF